MRDALLRMRADEVSTVTELPWLFHVMLIRAVACLAPAYHCTLVRRHHVGGR